MILTLIEHGGQGPLGNSLEALTVARDLAEAEGASLNAALVGAAPDAVVETLGRYGVDTVYVAQDERLEGEAYAPAAWAASLIQLIENHEPQAVVAAGTDRGNEIMAYVGARLDQPVAANCVRVETDSPYCVTRVRWGGSLLEEALLHGQPPLLTVAPAAVEAAEAPAASAPRVESFAPALDDGDFLVRVVGREETSREGVSLSSARIVIGGGRGVGSAEGFEVLEELAALTGGAVGGSRVVTNNGWRPHADQIGQTGARIAPDLYIACGISGAIQHMVGCQGAKQILAINSDPNAPIMAKADYAVVGDLHEIIPALTAELKKRKT
ncbi:MAG TPA: electron transfer flavoprotein subunit alpha/FixB family protein [Candidatus Sulfomarinibacteraceae bacterium]|nr:electron transfer flavoprotein subunit alpha/FixB family protein [Candidatus Sulfomarinibacteraceae bacterium]